MRLGKIISRYRPDCRVHVADYRLLFATPEQREAVLRQIEKRSQAAKAGWAKRRALARIVTRQGGDGTAPGEALEPEKAPKDSTQ